MSYVNVAIPQGCVRQFEDLLMDYQRTLPRRPGQFGVSVIYPPRSGPDVNGNVTFCGVPELALTLLKRSGIPHRIGA